MLANCDGNHNSKSHYLPFNDKWRLFIMWSFDGYLMMVKKYFFFPANKPPSNCHPLNITEFNDQRPSPLTIQTQQIETSESKTSRSMSNTNE